MLYTCSSSKAKTKVREMKQFFVDRNHGNDEVAPEKLHLDLYKKGDMTSKGFALNYEMKLRSSEAYKWMAKVSAEAIHDDVVLIGGTEEVDKTCRKLLAEMMVSMFGGKMNFRYAGEIE